MFYEKIIIFSIDVNYLCMGANGDWDFRISDLVKKKPDGTDI